MNAAAEKAPLDELMLAMDVVDTLRHRELMLERELAAEDRDAQLLERLREIYEAQGIEVTDQVLEEGVRALREDRFVYQGPEPGIGRSIALLWVTRERWLKWVLGTFATLAIAALAYQMLVRGPQLAEMRALPGDLQAAFQSVGVASNDPAALMRAQAALTAGEAALAGRDYRGARTAVTELERLGDRLDQEFQVRVVSRPGELSGVWRVPDQNERAQNFYLIVEAIGPNGAAIAMPVTNEEDGRVETVSKWGLRVDEETFRRFAADKRDDGIIQAAIVGEKPRGRLDPDFNITTTGATITRW